MEQLNNPGQLDTLTPDARILLKIVDQFARSKTYGHGYGLFEKDDQAYWFAQKMGREAVRNIRKQKIIPASFYLWLQTFRFLPDNFVLPHGGSTVKQLILNLRRSGVEVKQVLGYLEERRELHIKEYCNPELNRAFGTQQGTWTAIENVRNLRHAQRPR